MSCLSEKELETLYFQENDGFVGNFYAFPQDPLGKHIAECSFCADRFQWLQQFYKEVNHLTHRPPIPSENNLFREIAVSINPRISIAHPFVVSQPALLKGVSLSVLAAESAEGTKIAIYENLGVLITEDDKVIIRVIKAVKSGEVTLHLISEEEYRFKNVIVRIPFLDEEFISDENGKVKLGRVTIPDTEELHAEIQTPFATFDLSRLHLKKDKVIADTEIVLTNERNDSIKVEFFPADLEHTLKVHLLKIPSATKKSRLRVLVLRGERDRHLSEVQKGVAVFQGIKRNGELKVEVFD